MPVHVGRHTCGELPTLWAGQQLPVLTSFGTAKLLVRFEIAWFEETATELAGDLFCVVVPQVLCKAPLMFKNFLASWTLDAGVAEKKEKRFT